MVTDLRSLVMAYLMAARTRRELPSAEIGLMPMPDENGKRIFLTPISSCKNLMTFRAPSDVRPFDAGVDVFGVLAENDHVGQLRVLERGRHTLEVLHRTNALVEVKLLTQATFSERMPPPTGVVIGPLMETAYSFSASKVSLGNHSSGP
jgi:hypothetical protein